MNPKVTLILVVILIGLAGYVYSLGLGNEEGAEPDAGSGIPLYARTYGEYDLVALDVEGPTGSARFARTAETPTQDWAMVGPAALAPEALDQVRVNGAATRLAHLTASQVITGVTGLAQYGLDPPELTVTLTISTGQQLLLYTGAETPVGGNRYLQVAETPGSVYLVFSFAVDDLRRLIQEPPLAPTPLPGPEQTVSP